MPCIHGLDEINCPICRLIKSTFNISSSMNSSENQIKLNKYNLKPENSFIKHYFNKKEEFLNDLIPNKGYPNVNRINIIPKPNLMSNLPNFKNKMFIERLKEIDISKSDLFGISKKIPLESPEWKFKDKD